MGSVPPPTGTSARAAQDKRMDLFKKILTPGKPEAGDPGTPAAPPTQRLATDAPSTPTRERVASQDDVVQVCSSGPLSRGH